jgi:methylmalonyl-CoA/ethylmalonyl-CoA epimerase
MLKNLDHIGIVVDDLDKAVEQYTKLFGFRCTEIEEVPAQGMRIASVTLDRLTVELMESTSDTGVLAPFHRKRGAGIHHLAYAVEDIRGVLKTLTEQGLRLIDREPRRGGGNHWIAFLHPKDTGNILMEVCAPADDLDKYPRHPGGDA